MAGTMIGNFLALIIIVVSALVGISSLETSAITFIAIAYALWMIFLSMNLTTKPPKEAPLCELLSPNEIEVYQLYHMYIWAAGAAETFSSLMNGLRMAGFVWGGLCLWNGLYWLGGLSIAYFFISGGLILKLNPVLYLGAGAQNGNQLAIEHISLIEAVLMKREAYNAEQEE